MGSVRSPARKWGHIQGNASYQTKCTGAAQVCQPFAPENLSTATNLIRFSTDVNFIASQALARGQQRTQDGGEEGEGMDAAQEKADAMAALERQARAPVGFVAASTGPEGGNRPPPASQEQPQPSAPVNPDAIDLDDDMDAE